MYRMYSVEDYTSPPLLDYVSTGTCSFQLTLSFLSIPSARRTPLICANMSDLQCLPDKVLINIFSFLPHHAMLAKDDLKACSLASRRFRAIAQVWVFKNFVVDISHPRRNIQALLGFLFRSPLLAQHVRALWLHQTNYKGTLSALVIAYILRALPQVHSLGIFNVKLVCQPARPVASSSSIQQLSLPRKMRCLGISCHVESAAEGLWETLELFDRVDELTIEELPDNGFYCIQRPLGVFERLSHDGVALTKLGSYNFRLRADKVIFAGGPHLMTCAAAVFFRILQQTPTVQQLSSIEVRIQDHQQAAEVGEVFRVCGSTLKFVRLDFAYLPYYNSSSWKPIGELRLMLTFC